MPGLRSAGLASEGDGQDVEAANMIKVPEVGCSDAPAGRYGSGRDDSVVRADVPAGSGEFSPEAGVRTSGQEAEGQRRKRGQDALDEGLSASPVFRVSAVHAVQQLRGRDGGDPDLLVGSQLLFQAAAHLGQGASRGQAPDGALKVDEDGGV
jgi:hypothetical protein